MDKALYNVIFNRKKKLLSNGTALVQVEVYIKGLKKYFTTKIYLTPNQWDSKHRKVKNHPNAIRLNKQITDFIAILENIELARRNDGKIFSLTDLSDYLNGKKTDSFTDFMEREINESLLTLSTKDSMNTTLRTLNRYKQNILFSELNYELLSKYEQFLYARKISVNTINKQFAHIRKFVNLAINKELFDLNKYPFRKFKTKTETVKREFLTPEELEVMENIQLPKDKEYLQKSLDMFLFCCYTGLRYSDITALTKDNIAIEDTKYWIVIKMQKTREDVRIPLSALFNKKGIAILNRYTLDDSKKPFFDDLTNSQVNDHLKEIVELAKINKKITFHAARHTQATYLLYKGVSITTVQKLLGHKKIQTTQIYTKIMDVTIVQDLEKVSF